VSGEEIPGPQNNLINAKAIPKGTAFDLMVNGSLANRVFAREMLITENAEFSIKIQ
jgi:hypothetical protein